MKDSSTFSNILFLSSIPPGFVKAWRKRGYRALKAEEKFQTLPVDQMEERIAYYQREMGIQAVFTFDFSPQLAECCTRHGIRYISWSVDCPHLPLWHKAADNEFIYNFVFDYSQYRMLKSKGMQHAIYLPLCADVEAFEKCIRERAGTGHYGADVTFLGNLYTDKHHTLYDQITYLPPYVRGYVDALIGAQRKIWGENLLQDTISDYMWEQLRKYVKWDLGDEYPKEVYELEFSGMLADKVAQLERKEVCSYLAAHYDFALYTNADTIFDPNIDNRGHADYLTEMPLIFHDSKINIHITLRSIYSGISLRVLDVLACEGFLLTNYQPEIAEYFVDGEELVMYSDFEDMYAKIDYYLTHDEERKRIAHAGYLKVKEQFNYDVGVEKIIEVLEGMDE